MTKKHFIAIAKILATNTTKAEITIALVDYFHQENHNFNAVKFLEACGVTKED